MTLRASLTALTLSLSVVIVPTAAAYAYAAPRYVPTPEQTQQVKDAVAELRAEGLPAPLDQAPQVRERPQIMVSDAISVVEVAHVDFNKGSYYLSVHNPWTNVTNWYGEFTLPQR